jgi:hypothetical protein
MGLYMPSGDGSTQKLTPTAHLHIILAHTYNLLPAGVVGETLSPDVWAGVA